MGVYRKLFVFSFVFFVISSTLGLVLAPSLPAVSAWQLFVYVALDSVFKAAFGTAFATAARFIIWWIFKYDIFATNRPAPQPKPAPTFQPIPDLDLDTKPTDPEFVDFDPFDIHVEKTWGTRIKVGEIEFEQFRRINGKDYEFAGIAPPNEAGFGVDLTHFRDGTIAFGNIAWEPIENQPLAEKR